MSVGVEEPALPWPVRAMNALGRPVAPRLLSLDPDDLVRAARRRTRLDDLGDDRFREPLRTLTRALEDEARLTVLGRVAARAQLTGLLATRLRVEDLLRRRPAILGERVVAPIVVVGMPRTGTTMLHRLLAADPGLRSLPYWEALNPLPPGDATVVPPPPDPRIRTAERSLAVLHWCAPAMLAMHEMAARAPDEEIWLLAIDFATMLFEASYRVPSFAAWYDAHDQTPGYRWLRRMLQVLQWYRRGDRWVLKSPQHLGQLGPLRAVFPDAVVVQTHRDPVKVVASFASMTSYGARMNTDAVDPPAIAAHWLGRIETLLRRSAEDRPADGARFVDVRFDELMRDPLAVVRRIYAVADRPLTPAAEQAMRAWLAANPRAKHGAHVYRLSDFALDAADVRRRFAAYVARFDVPSEEGAAA